MGSFLLDALWKDLELGLLARSREARDACAALHAKGDADALVREAAAFFEKPATNEKEAIEAALALVGKRDLRREAEKRALGRRAEFFPWLYDVVVAGAPELATSRLFLDPAFPDRAWVKRDVSWQLAWRHDGAWKLTGLAEVRASAAPPLETLLVLRVAGLERPNPRLPRP